MRAAFFLHLAAVTAQVVSLPDYEDDCIEDKGVAEKDGFEITFYDAFWGRPGSLPSPYNWIIDTGTSYPGGVSFNIKFRLSIIQFRASVE